MHDTRRFLVAGDMHTRADASATVNTIVHTRTVPTTLTAVIAVAAKTMTNTEIIRTLQPHTRGEEETNKIDVDLTHFCLGTNKMCLQSTLLEQSDPAMFGIGIRPIFGPSRAKVGTRVNNRQRNKYNCFDAR